MQILDKWVQHARSYVGSLSFTNGAMKYILWYAALLVVCCVMYLTAWCIDWAVRGEPNLKDLLAFLHEIASASWVAVIGFVCKGLVDRDADGIPDEFQEKDGVDNGKHRL
jgi:hypothetical protein